MGRSLGSWSLAIGCLLGLALACFGPALSPSRQLAYRDYSDFYYPLYQRVQQEWHAGRLPLWSVEENAGSPILGNPTSAVLYPGKLIYALLPYPLAAKVYVLAHVLLAFGAMVAMLRRWGVSSVGSTLGGMAYAFGAPVLTQYSNVVFLVGAAWMPLGFLCADRWVRLGRPRAVAGLAIVLAMQVLGGDPEAAYLTGFAAGCYASARWASGRPGRIGTLAIGLVLAYACLLGLEVARLPTLAARPSWRPSPSTASLVGWSVVGAVLVASWRWKRTGGRVLGLIVAGVVGAMLTGVQLLPTLEFIGQSTRSGEAPHLDIYAHSIHPARLVEWAWPNAFGSTASRDHKWLAALPPTMDHRIWMTSIYPGGLTLLLAAGAVGFRGATGTRGWMLGLALVGLLAGFGTFGSPLFWARSIAGTEARWGALEEPETTVPRLDGRLRDGDGGAYWFLASALPGFRSFRYPGKLFIPAALGMAALAGMGFDGLMGGRRRPGLALAGVLLAAGLAGLGFEVARPKAVLEFLAARTADASSVFGPFDPSGASRDLRRALIYGSLVMVAFLEIARLAPRYRGLAGALALVAMAVDLGLSNRGEVATVPQAAYEAESRALAAIRADAANDGPGSGPYRVFRLDGWVPVDWNRRGSPDRLEQMVRWERESLRPKSGEPLGVESTFAYATTELADYGPFFEPFTIPIAPAKARELRIPAGRPVNYFPRRGFDLWNTRYVIAPIRMSWSSRFRGFASFLPDSRAIYPPQFVGPDAKADLGRWGEEVDLQVLRNLNAFPRAWVVHRAIPVGTNGASSMDDRRRVMIDLLHQGDELWRVEGKKVADPFEVAWVEAPDSALAGLSGEPSGPEPVRVIMTDDPTLVELEVALRSTGLVVLADICYPGWTLEIDGRPAEILRTNRAMRGAVVPAGRHRLVYRYRPRSVVIGAAVSAIGGLAWLGIVAFGRVRRDRTDPDIESQHKDVLS